jgi:hypothetical protein
MGLWGVTGLGTSRFDHLDNPNPNLGLLGVTWGYTYLKNRGEFGNSDAGNEPVAVELPIYQLSGLRGTSYSGFSNNKISPPVIIKSAPCLQTA